jgi:hypothetical protein
MPDAGPGHLDVLGQVVHARLLRRHREQDARAPGDAVFDSAVVHERLQLLAVSIRKADPAWGTASHRTRS